MTRVETLQGLYWAIQHLFGLKDVRFRKKARLAVLKCVAVLAYDAGKGASLKRPYFSYFSLPTVTQTVVQIAVGLV